MLEPRLTVSGKCNPTSKKDSCMHGFLRSFLLLAGSALCIEAIAHEENLQPYVDPEIAPVLSNEGNVNVIVTFKSSPFPNAEIEPGGDQQERAKALGNARRQDYGRKLQAFKAFVNSSGFSILITEEFDRSLSLVVSVSDERLLRRIAEFPHVQSLHWADRTVSTQKYEGDLSLLSTPPDSELDGRMHRQLINQTGAAVAGFTGLSITVAVIEPERESNDEYVLTYNNSRINPRFRVKRFYNCGNGGCSRDTPDSSYFERRTDQPTPRLNHHEAVWRSIAVAAPDASIVHFSLSGGVPPTQLSYKRVMNQISALVESGMEDINVINFSSGSGEFSQPCRSQSAYDIEIFDLRRLGIPLIAPAGNESLYDKLNDPACHPDAISVGHQWASTGDATPWSDPDSCHLGKLWRPGDINCRSNSAWFLDFMAPGCGYLTPKEYRECGSSFAAPIVAGAFAAVKSASPHLTAPEIINILKTEGGSVTENRSWNGVYANRSIDTVDLGRAAAAAHLILPPKPGDGNSDPGDGDPATPPTKQIQIINVITEILGL